MFEYVPANVSVHPPLLVVPYYRGGSASIVINGNWTHTAYGAADNPVVDA